MNHALEGRHALVVGGPQHPRREREALDQAALSPAAFPACRCSC
jgi:hypothetical protein